jgi:hypothetical protein
MLTKMLAALVLMVSFASTAIAVDEPANIRVGDLVALRMSGKLAEEYSRRIGVLQPDQKPQPGMQLETTGTVCQVLDNGQIRIECSLPTADHDKKQNLITLTALVDAKEIRPDSTPKGTPLYSSPGDQRNGIKPVRVDHEVRGLKLELSDLKHIKLKTWILADEIGD